MSDIGKVTGIIGAVTGSVGCIIGWISYRRSQQIERLDLRLELRKKISGVCVEIEALPALLERARRSRSAVSAAKGRGPQSGSSLAWNDELEDDLKTVHSLAGELPNASETYQSSKAHELENKLVEIHALEVKASQLRMKYEKALASDDRDREHIRAQAGRRAGQ